MIVVLNKNENMQLLHHLATKSVNQCSLKEENNLYMFVYEFIIYIYHLSFSSFFFSFSDAYSIKSFGGSFPRSCIPPVTVWLSEILNPKLVLKLPPPATERLVLAPDEQVALCSVPPASSAVLPLV